MLKEYLLAPSVAELHMGLVLCVCLDAHGRLVDLVCGRRRRFGAPSLAWGCVARFGLAPTIGRCRCRCDLLLGEVGGLQRGEQLLLLRREGLDSEGAKQFKKAARCVCCCCAEIGL